MRHNIFGNEEEVLETTGLIDEIDPEETLPYVDPDYSVLNLDSFFNSLDISDKAIPAQESTIDFYESTIDSPNQEACTPQNVQNRDSVAHFSLHKNEGNPPFSNLHDQETVESHKTDMLGDTKKKLSSKQKQEIPKPPRATETRRGRNVKPPRYLQDYACDD